MRVRFVYEGHLVKVKVTGAKNIENPTPAMIGNKSASIKHKAMKFACSMGFSDMADPMV